MKISSKEKFDFLAKYEFRSPSDISGPFQTAPVNSGQMWVEACDLLECRNGCEDDATSQKSYERNHWTESWTKISSLDFRRNMSFARLPTSLDRSGLLQSAPHTCGSKLVTSWNAAMAVRTTLLRWNLPDEWKSQQRNNLTFDEIWVSLAIQQIYYVVLLSCPLQPEALPVIQLLLYKVTTQKKYKIY